jgi:hypothetical protein
MLVGGTGENGLSLTTTEIFDSRTMAFSNGPDLPTPRSPRAVFTLKDGSVVAAGGGNSSGGVRVPLVSADILAPGATAWRRVPLTGATAASNLLRLADDSLLAVGGILGRSPSSQAVRVDLSTGAATRVEDMPQPGALFDQVLLADGRALFAGPVNDAFQIYDPASGHWRSGSHSLPVGAPVVTLRDGRAIVLGGDEAIDPEDPDTAFFFDRVHVFDPRTNEWEDFAPLLAPREAPSVTLLRDGRVLVVGGIDGLNGTCDPKLGAEIYSP